MMTVAMQGLHGIVAMATAAPEMQINNDEAETLSKAIVPLMAHYSVVPPPEMILWTNLFSALAFVEGPRIALIRMRKMDEKAARAKPVYDSAKQPEMYSGTAAAGMPN